MVYKNKSNNRYCHNYIMKYGFDIFYKSIIKLDWFQSLTTLYLNNNHIGNKGVEFIAIYKPRFLKNLYLCSNDIDKDGAKSIANELIYKSKFLICLHLNDNNISDDGANYIIESSCINKSLIDLYLDNNNISSMGIKSIINLLKFNKNLYSLYLNDNDINEIQKEFIYILLNNNKINKKNLKKEHKVSKIYILEAFPLLKKPWQFEFLEFFDSIEF